jgi:RNA polymerase sigma-70 factor (ECF subfamily)
MESDTWVLAMLDDDLLKQLREDLRRFIHRRVDDADSAEDLAQEVMLRAHQHGGSLTTPAAVRHWAFRVASNLVVDHHRRRGAGRVVAGDPSDVAAGEREQAEEGRGLASCLPRMVEGLPYRYRRAVELVEFAGMTQETAGSVLGLSLSGTKSRVQRGRAELRRRLLECCDVELDARGGVVGYEPTEKSARYCGGKNVCVHSGDVASS